MVTKANNGLLKNSTEYSTNISCVCISCQALIFLHQLRILQTRKQTLPPNNLTTDFSVVMVLSSDHSKVNQEGCLTINTSLNNEQCIFSRSFFYRGRQPPECQYRTAMLSHNMKLSTFTSKKLPTSMLLGRSNGFDFLCWMISVFPTVFENPALINLISLIPLVSLLSWGTLTNRQNQRLVQQSLVYILVPTPLSLSDSTFIHTSLSMSTLSHKYALRFACAWHYYVHCAK